MLASNLTPLVFQLRTFQLEWCSSDVTVMASCALWFLLHQRPLSPPRPPWTCGIIDLVTQGVVFCTKPSPTSTSSPASCRPPVIVVSLASMLEHLQSLSKPHSLNYHLESHLHKNRFLYLFTLTVFLYPMRTLESHSRFLVLAREKSGIKDGYIWMTI